MQVSTLNESRERVRQISIMAYVVMLALLLPLTLFAIKQEQQLHSSAAPLTTNSGRPFADGSAWNVPIGANVQIDPNNAAIMAKLVTGQHGAALYDFGTPIFYADAATPKYKIDCTQPWGVCGLENEMVPIPEGAQPAPGSDGQMVIVDLTNKKSYEFWQYKNDKATTSWGGILPLDGDGRGTPLNHAVGAGTSRLAGVIRTYELVQGEIDHALVFSSSFCQGPDNGTNFRYPATKTDGKYAGTDGIPEGARIQLDPAVNVDLISGITQGEKIVAKALQKYGAYAIDCGGATMAFSFENPIGKTDPYAAAGFSSDYFEMSHIPWDKVRVLAAWNSFDGAQSPVPSSGLVPSNSIVSPTVPLITPTYGVIAPCPSCAVSTVTPTISSATIPTGSTNTPSGIVAVPTITNPCSANDAAIASDNDKKHRKHHKKHDGGISGFMEALLKFFFQLITLLLQLLGGGQLPNPVPGPEPSTESPDPCAPTGSPTSTPPPPTTQLQPTASKAPATIVPVATQPIVNGLPSPTPTKPQSQIPAAPTNPPMCIQSGQKCDATGAKACCSGVCVKNINPNQPNDPGDCE